MNSFRFFIFLLLLLPLTQVCCQSLSSSTLREMSRRETRYHHFLWHNIRNLWNKMDSETQDAVRRLGWAPPRASQRFTASGTAVALEDNNSGEDFLFMHREMFRRVGNIPGWETIPGPGDTEYPVPPAYDGLNSELTQSIRNFKTSSFYQNSIRRAEQRFKDPNYLRSVTLGQLGSRIEFTFHNWVHIRFSERPSTGMRVRSNSNPIPDVDERWDNPRYTWLIDSYASHLNPIFYKIHGWVDARIEDWRRANGLTTITWRGRWVGGQMSMMDDLVEEAQDIRQRTLEEMPSKVDNEGVDTGHGSGSKDSMAAMEEVAKLLFKTGMESQLCDKVLFEEDLPVSERLHKRKNKSKGKDKYKGRKQKRSRKHH